MNASIDFDYQSTHQPAAPFLPIAVDGYDATKPPVIVYAFLDTGADGTMLPLDILLAVGAEYENTVQMRGIAGDVQLLDRYTVRIQIENEIVHAISAVATTVGSEALLGRDVLNHLILTLNGPAQVIELQVAL